MRLMTKHAVIATVMLTMGVTAVLAQAPPAQPRPPQTFTAYLQGQYNNIKSNLVRSAEKMPAEHFGFRPAPEVMTYAELLGHVVNTQYAYCNAVKGGPNPAAGKDFTKTAEQPAMVQIVKDSFAYCDDAFAALTDASATEMITVGMAPNQRQISRANQLTQLVVHGNEHYGNIVTYLRIKGIVPPSSSK